MEGLLTYTFSLWLSLLWQEVHNDSFQSTQTKQTYTHSAEGGRDMTPAMYKNSCSTWQNGGNKGETENWEYVGECIWYIKKQHFLYIYFHFQVTLKLYFARTQRKNTGSSRDHKKQTKRGLLLYICRFVTVHFWATIQCWLNGWELFGLKYVYSVFGSSYLCGAHWSWRNRKWHVEMQILLLKMQECWSTATPTKNSQ